MRTKARVILPLCVIAVLPALAQSQDSTHSTSESRTLAKVLGIRAMHVAWGGGSVPYLDTPGGGGTAEFRLGITPRAIPDWTFAFTGSAVIECDTTSYVTPGSNDFHPRMTSTAVGLEAQRRWRRASLFHPMLVGAVGQITNSYTYWEYRSNGRSEFHEDYKRAVTYAALGGGGEISVFTWMRLAMTLSYRAAGGVPIPSARGTNSGIAGSMLFELGKF